MAITKSETKKMHQKGSVPPKKSVFVDTNRFRNGCFCMNQSFQNRVLHISVVIA